MFDSCFSSLQSPNLFAHVMKQISNACDTYHEDKLLNLISYQKNKTGKVLIRILIFTICKLWPSPFPVSSFSYFSWHWYLTKLLQKFSRVPSFRLPFWGAIFAVFLPESCLKFGTEESANSSNFQFHRIFGGRVRFWLTFEILKLFEMAGLMFTNFLLGWHSQCQRGRERLRYWFVCNCAENQNKLSWKQRKLQ